MDLNGLSAIATVGSFVIAVIAFLTDFAKQGKLVGVMFVIGATAFGAAWVGQSSVNLQYGAPSTPVQGPDFEALIEAAGNLRFNSDQDASYKKIIALAVDYQRFDVALKVVQKLNYRFDRDDEVKKLCGIMISARSYAYAEKCIQGLRFSGDREAFRKRLISNEQSGG